MLLLSRHFFEVGRKRGGCLFSLKPCTGFGLGSTNETKPCTGFDFVRVNETKLRAFFALALVEMTS